MPSAASTSSANPTIPANLANAATTAAAASAEHARPRGVATAPANSVGPLTPHLYAPDAVRPLRAKEHFLSADTLVELHQHPWPQLTFSTRGVIRLSTQDGSYIVPPSRALWVPANMPHSITLIEDAELRTVYLHAWIAPPGRNARCSRSARCCAP
jgi:hypothetical protein